MAWRSHLLAAVRHPSERKVLLLRSDREWRLPRALVRDAVWGANARVILPSLERRLRTTLWLVRLLRLVEDEASERVVAAFELELTDSGWQPPANGRWAGREDVERLRLRADERELLTGYFDGLEDIPAERAPWSRPGWLGEVRPWLEAEAGRLGLRVTSVEQVKHWSISSVLRIVTDGPELYLKVPARLPLFAEEAAVTARLAERFPDHVPAPLAVEPERGLLLLPAFEHLPGWGAPLAERAEMLRRFGQLQQLAAQQVDELLADGCLDRRLEVLEAQIGPLVADAEATRKLTDEERAELGGLVPTLREFCRRLAEVGPAPTLVHGDLHMLNTARLDGKVVYFDWTDACIAHPFIDLHSLQWEKDETSRAALLDAYLDAWEGVETPERLREAVALAAVVIPLHHAVSYRTIVAALEPDAKHELDAAHGFLREALLRVRDWPEG